MPSIRSHFHRDKILKRYSVISNNGIPLAGPDTTFQPVFTRPSQFRGLTSLYLSASIVLRKGNPNHPRATSALIGYQFAPKGDGHILFFHQGLSLIMTGPETTFTPGGSALTDYGTAVDLGFNCSVAVASQTVIIMLKVGLEKDHSQRRDCASFHWETA